jgi:fructose-bisphosphate aldolase, class II
MALVSMRQLLDHAAEHGYGLPAFNVNNMEQIRAIMEAADQCDSPVILQGSAGARKYAGEAFLRHLVAAAVETWPRHAPGSRRQPGRLPARHSLGLHQRHDGWLADGRRQDAFQL